MALKLDTIGHMCHLVSRQVRDRFKNLTIHFIVHHQGQRVEALGMAGQEILYHPAAETALYLLTNARHTDESSLIGMAVARQNVFFGLASRNSMLALCSINSDQYEDVKEARLHAYHLAWHAIDSLQYHSNLSAYAGESQKVVIRRRNALEMAAANLQADVFSTVMASLEGDRDAVRQTAIQRGKNVLSLVAGHKPEHYPFVIAADTTAVALGHAKQTPLPKKKYIDAALKVAREVGKTYDEETLKDWLRFAEPAQDMAWRGADSREVLSAAIHTSDNTFVRATGYQIAEITAIKPVSILQVHSSYTPYADDAFNEKIHERAVDEIFEDIIARGVQQNSGRPFIEMANEQNARLLDGQVVGWCAAALQASGQAFDQALKEGKEPEGLARKEFTGERDRTTWGALKQLSQKIIGQQREGHNVGLEDVDKLAGESAILARLRKSVELTLQDPAYQRENSPELTKAGPQVRPPAPEATQRLARGGPAMSGPAMGAPGLGGGIPGRIAAAVTRRKGQQAGKQPETAETQQD